jgi:hypothetical protein
MIAGLATHASLQDPARPFIYTDEGFVGIRRELTEAEANAVEAYRRSYSELFGDMPGGLHYVRIESAVREAVYFPLSGADLEE